MRISEAFFFLFLPLEPKGGECFFSGHFGRRGHLERDPATWGGAKSLTGEAQLSSYPFGGRATLGRGNCRYPEDNPEGYLAGNRLGRTKSAPREKQMCSMAENGEIKEKISKGGDRPKCFQYVQNSTNGE